MAQMTRFFGFALVVLGLGGFLLTWALRGTIAPTAMIPAAFGLALVLLGLMANREKLRMHAMHGAVLVGLVGFIVPAVMVIRGILAETISYWLAPGLQICMSLICFVFVVFCVRSFIDARRARKANEHTKH
jgi:FtsH-binding integral membrane protein